MHIDLPDKLYYKIGEISKAFDVNPSLIRFWEKEFKTLNPKKDKRGARLYTSKDIEKLKQIYILVKEKGFTLDGAKLKIKEDKNSPNASLIQKNFSVLDRLEKIKLELLQIKDSLN